MANYEMRCDICKVVVEVRCLIAQRETQKCATCCGALIPLFTPTTNIYIPNAFRYSFSDLFGTSSEKEYLKEHPELERINHSTFVSAEDRRKKKVEKAKKEADEIERAINANRTLRGQEPKQIVKIEAGSMESDIPK